MRAHLISDLHTEFFPYTYTPPPGGCDVVVLAGDIGSPKHPGRLSAVLAGAARHAPVIYVPGNHEFYNHGLAECHRRLEGIAYRAGEGAPHRIHLLTGGRNVVIGGVRFAGMTLWTDFGLNGNPVLGELAALGLRDFKIIRTDQDTVLTPRYVAELHRCERNTLERTHGLADMHDERLVVVSHFLPAPGSLDTRFRGSPLNPYFCTDLSAMITGYLSRRLVAWFHGHSHASCDYRVGQCRVVCNPRGYERENQAYDKHLTVDIPT